MKKKYIFDPLYKSKNLNQMSVAQKRRVLQKRLEKCLQIPVMKKLGSIRLLTGERAFLRWKVKVDTKLQNKCVKRFAVKARISHAVAIWRLRWLVERSKLDSEEKGRGY